MNEIPLVKALLQHPRGLCGQHDPAASAKGIENLNQRISVLTLGVVLDNNPISADRWTLLVSLHDHWLLDPSQAAFHSSAEIQSCMQQLHLSAPQYVARVWWQICRGIQGRFKGCWRDLVKANSDSAQILSQYLQASKATFPVLSGPVISVRWMDLVHRIGEVTLQGWDNLTVPLTAQQVKSANQFGLTEENVHPLVAVALDTWGTSCRSLELVSCGLEHCPARKTG